MAFKIETAFGQTETFIDDKPKISDNEDFILMFSASGIELDLIRIMFSNIPISNSEIKVVWFGEMAQFLYHNLDI